MSSSNKQESSVDQFNAPENEFEATNQGPAPGEATNSSDNTSGTSKQGGDSNSTGDDDDGDSNGGSDQDGDAQDGEGDSSSPIDQIKDQIQKKIEDLVAGFLKEKLGWSDESVDLFMQGSKVVISQIADNINK